MDFCSIASGSSGNCIYVGSDQSHILVDAGISNKRIEQGLNDIGLKGAELDGVVITHEHSDHIKGLGVLSRKYGVPIYTTSANYGKYWVQDCSAAMENLLLAARAKELASLWCGVHPVPEREQAFRELFNLPDTVSPLGLAILGYSETPFSHKERYDEQKVHYNVW